MGRKKELKEIVMNFIVIIVVILFCSCFLCLNMFSNSVDIKVIKFCLIFVIILFSFNRFKNGYFMYKEYLKQEFLIENFSRSLQVKENEVFLIDWDTSFSQYEKPAFYELSGYAYKAYNTRNHLIVVSEKESGIKKYYLVKDLQDYKCKDITHYEIMER